MSKLIAVTILAVLSSVAAEPLLFSAPLASPYYAAYMNPGSYLAAPLSSAYTVPGPAVRSLPASALSAVPGVQAAIPQVPYPYSSVSAYSYGSTYSIQDYLPTVVNPAPSSLAYSMPYAYAADYYYRR